MYNLLILSCSATKRPDEGLLEAQARYDGPGWRIVRSSMRARPSVSERLVTWVLSAEFGLIPASQPIADYNRKMSPARAAELAPLVAAQFAELARPYAAEGIATALICAGKVYLTALAPIEEPLAALCRTPVEVTARNHPRGIGDHNAMLSTWLSTR